MPSEPDDSYDFNDKVLEAIFLRKHSEAGPGPVEKTWERATVKRIVSKHNLDLGILSVAYLLVVIAVIWAVLYYFTDEDKAYQLLLGSAIFGVIVGLIGRTYDTALKRLSTVDLFISEMLSIGRVFVAANIIGEFVRIYDKLGGAERDGAAGYPPDKARPSGFADAARRENYFSIFEKNCQELGTLDPAVIDDVAAFYTFLKAARDATGAMTLWKEPHYDTGMMKSDVTNTIYLCFLMMIHGRRALDRLIESKNNKEIANRIFLGVERQCFTFLDHKVGQQDFRRQYIDLRKEDPEFRSPLNAGHSRP
jgi:hypothetical protein